MRKLKVTKVDADTTNHEKGNRVTIENEDGKTVVINIPFLAWGDDPAYGLNLVFDHSGNGDHYS